MSLILWLLAGYLAGAMLYARVEDHHLFEPDEERRLLKIVWVLSMVCGPVTLLLALLLLWVQTGNPTGPLKHIWE